MYCIVSFTVFLFIAHDSCTVEYGLPVSHWDKFYHACVYVFNIIGLIF